jgi:two-component system, LytTR family, response regulator
MQINCIAVDDEPLALKKMKQYIDKVDLLNCLEYIDNGIDAINFIKQNKIDLVFLDIQMNDLSGIELLETLSKKPIIVFTTAYENYALQGYELNVTDYLLKPISFKRFLKSIDKITEMVNVENDDSKNQTAFKTDIPENEYIFLKVDNKMQKILFKDILYVEAMKDYVKIWTSAGKILFLCNIKSFMEKIPDNQFVRIHKSFAIAFNKIDAIKQKYVEIAGKDIPIGSTYRNLFFSLLRNRGLI